MNIVVLPRLDSMVASAEETVPYEVLEPPIPPDLFRQSAEDVKDEALAEQWVGWLTATEGVRSGYATAPCLCGSAGGRRISRRPASVR